MEGFLLVSDGPSSWTRYYARTDPAAGSIAGAFTQNSAPKFTVQLAGCTLTKDGIYLVVSFPGGEPKDLKLRLDGDLMDKWYPHLQALSRRGGTATTTTTTIAAKPQAAPQPEGRPAPAATVASAKLPAATPAPRAEAPAGPPTFGTLAKAAAASSPAPKAKPVPKMAGVVTMAAAPAAAPKPAAAAAGLPPPAASVGALVVAKPRPSEQEKDERGSMLQNIGGKVIGIAAAATSGLHAEILTATGAVESVSSSVTSAMMECTGMAVMEPFLLSVMSIAGVVYEAAKTAAANVQLFATLSQQSFTIQSLVTRLQTLGKLSPSLTVLLHEVYRVLNDALELVNKYANQHWVCNWLFANRMRDEVTDVYNDLQRAALNLSLAIAVDGQEKIQQIQELRISQPALPAPPLDDDPRGILSLPPVPDSALDLENILLHERCERLEFGTGDTPLSKARAGKFMEMYKLLVDGMGGANDLGRNYTLLHQAVFWESKFGVVVLINYGADVNAQTIALDPTLQLAQGSTPLHIAALLGNEAIIRLLLCSGADPNIKDGKGMTPAQLNTSPQCRKLLVDPAVVRLGQEMCGLAKGQRFAQAIDFAVRHHLPLDIKQYPGMEGSDYYIIHQVAYGGDTQSYRIMLAHGACPLLRTMGKDGERRLPSAVARSQRKLDAAKYMELEERKAMDRLA
eukprot:EG_transcript_3055